MVLHQIQRLLSAKETISIALEKPIELTSAGIERALETLVLFREVTKKPVAAISQSGMLILVQFQSSINEGRDESLISDA